MIAMQGERLCRKLDRAQQSFGADLRKRAVRSWSSIRKLPECLHQPHSA